jgi:hypothetical protein
LISPISIFSLCDLNLFLIPSGNLIALTSDGGIRVVKMASIQEKAFYAFQ